MSDKANGTNLLPALLAFQAECPTLPKDATNPHFKSKFVSLDTIVEKVGPLLAAHGLTWSTFPCHDEHGPALRYVLAHAASGETLEGTMPLLLTKNDPQGQGSAITYARRYSICAVLNLVADEDDDGNAGSVRTQQKRQQTPQERKPSPLSPENRAKVLKAFSDAGINDLRTHLTAVGLARVEDMTAKHAVQLRESLDKELAEQGVLA